MDKFSLIWKEIFDDEPIADKNLFYLDSLLTRVLGTSNQKSRDKLRKFLKKWEMRMLFVDALQEEKDKNLD